MILFLFLLISLTNIYSSAILNFKKECDFLKISKFVKKKNGMYDIILDGKSYTIHEDLILKYELLLKKELTEEQFCRLEQENFNYQVYEVALKMLKSRLHSKKQLRNKLLQKGFSTTAVENAIELLVSQGYLDDSVYAESYIHDKILFSSDGPLKIKKNLLTQDIPLSLIDDKLVVFTKEIEREKLEKIIQKQLKSNRKSLSAFQLKMKQHCASLGYNNSLVSSCLENINFDEDYLLKKEYDKLYRKLSSKYQGRELEYKIQQKLYQKGFRP